MVLLLLALRKKIMILRAQNLMKSYGGRKVVKDVSLEVKQGEIVGLLGAKWCGKNNFFLYDRGFDKT